MYTPLEFADTQVHFFLLTIVGFIAFIISMVLLFAYSRDGKGKNQVISALVVVASVAATGVSIWQLEREAVSTEEQNKQSMIENISAKYTLDTSKMEIADSYRRFVGPGTYDFALREESAVKRFQIEFMEDGEPFLVVNDDMTSQLAEEFLR